MDRRPDRCGGEGRLGEGTPIHRPSARRGETAGSKPPGGGIGPIGGTRRGRRAGFSRAAEKQLLGGREAGGGKAVRACGIAASGGEN